jgi:DNA-binding CsgD family transcriptional regulator
MLDRADKRCIDGIRAELRTVRIGQASVVNEVLSEVRNLLHTEIVSIYAVGETVEGWGLTRWEQSGGDLTSGALLERAIRQSSTPMFYYDAVRPPADQRNRVVEATSWVDRHVPGTWESSRMCQEVLRPIGLHQHKQVRALICDGPALVGWFGVVQTAPATRRQVRLQHTLIPALRQRLIFERDLAAATRTADAFRAALEHLGAPAFILGAHGTIHETNVAGRALLTEDRAEITGALEDALAGRANAREIALVPLLERGVATHFLAIVRHDPVEGRIGSCVQHCVARWSLTPRQAEVLALVARGLANATIAATMRVGERSVELHMTAIFDRAGVDSRAALVATILTSN